MLEMRETAVSQRRKELLYLVSSTLNGGVAVMYGEEMDLLLKGVDFGRVTDFAKSHNT